MAGAEQRVERVEQIVVGGCVRGRRHRSEAMQAHELQILEVARRLELRHRPQQRRIEPRLLLVVAAELELLPEVEGVHDRGGSTSWDRFRLLCPCREPTKGREVCNAQLRLANGELALCKGYVQPDSAQHWVENGCRPRRRPRRRLPFKQLAQAPPCRRHRLKQAADCGCSG
eukprot:scaffold4033_cov60-Phaeocystis_antarctica.AAC.2